MSKDTYLGEKVIPIDQTPFKGWSASDWALYYVERYGGFDGAHHKTWVLDQVARILKGTPVIISRAEWTDHEPEWRVTLREPPTQEYLNWVKDMKAGEDGPDTYEYDEGIAP